ncbi:flagellar hook-length control protein [Pullulanibacillus camelliae]|uniref:Flagellar hook-length control protein n=1 Tax=Pullulanibacillus camelliae TaxID=1707096 RepID=A0A8J2W3J2_9BACL|nr:flagellar hook-length control protein FliK [Pullulanibacillus camelliae]GGE42147.1 flagellar hook-length control protein [Pullulanibacillus camelliae]
MNGNLAVVPVATDINPSGRSVNPKGKTQTGFDAALQGSLRESNAAGSAKTKASGQEGQSVKESFQELVKTLKNLLNGLDTNSETPTKASDQGMKGLQKLLTDLEKQLNGVETGLQENSQASQTLDSLQSVVSDTKQLMQLLTDSQNQDQTQMANGTSQTVLPQLFQVIKELQATLTDQSTPVMAADPSKGVTLNPAIEKLLKQKDPKLLAEIQTALGAVLQQLQQTLTLIGKSINSGSNQAILSALNSSAAGQQGNHGSSPLVQAGEGMTNGTAQAADKSQEAQTAQPMAAGKAGATQSAGLQNDAKGQQQDDQNNDSTSSRQPFFTTGTMNKVQQFVLHVGKTDQPNVSQQIADQVKSVIASGNLKSSVDGNMQLTVKLNPANLGTLNVTLLQTDDGLLATITAHSGATKDLIESQLSQLKHALASTGINVQKIDVNQVGQTQHSDAQQQQGEGQQHSSGEGHQEQEERGRYTPAYSEQDAAEEDFTASLSEWLSEGNESIEY